MQNIRKNIPVSEQLYAEIKASEFAKYGDTWDGIINKIFRSALENRRKAKGGVR